MFVTLLATAVGCAGSSSERPGRIGGAPAPAGGKPSPRVHAKRTPKPVPRPSRPLSREEAEKYVLALVNRDREAEGLEPVAWDPIAAKAGRRHAEDMAHFGYTGHWGTDGSVPEQRHTEAGGHAMVQENAACFFDAKERALDPRATYDAEALEKIEAAFMNEKPPHDGHRKNILTPWHVKFGVGVAQPVGVRVPCMSQEFTDDYGSYADLPAKAKLGQVVRVAGKIASPAAIAGVGVARIALPSAMTAEQLNKTHSYPVPQPYVTYFPSGYVTPIPVKVSGDEFSIEVPLSDGGKPGLYEVSVWGEVPETKDLVMLSLRTVRVE